MSALNPVEMDVEVGDAGAIGFELCESAAGSCGRLGFAFPRGAVLRGDRSGVHESCCAVAILI